MSKNKKTIQLGMNPSTASGRLVKDILWKYIVDAKHDKCCKCGEEMTRNDFSIEHIIPWLDSEDPVTLFFDMDNISFSHLKCNVASRRITNRKYETPEHSRQAELKRSRDYRRNNYDPVWRSNRYKTEGR